MKGFISIATMAAVLGALVVLLVAPAQAYGINELIAKKQHAQSKYEYWDGEFVRLQHQLNNLYARKNHNRHNWRRLRRIDDRIHRVQNQLDRTGRKARFWHREYTKYASRLRDMRRHQVRPRPPHRRPGYREPVYPRRPGYRGHGPYRGGINFGMGFSDGNNGFSFFIGGR